MSTMGGIPIISQTWQVSYVHHVNHGRQTVKSWQASIVSVMSTMGGKLNYYTNNYQSICVLIHGQPDPALLGPSCCGADDTEILFFTELWFGVMPCHAMNLGSWPNHV